MNKEDMKELVKCLMWSFVLSTLVCCFYWFSYFFIKEELNNDMEFFMDKLLVPIITGLITLLVTLISTLLVNRKNQTTKLTETVDKLNQRLGEFKNRTLENMLGNMDKSSVNDYLNEILSDIGLTPVNNPHSLTKQHDEMKNVINKEIEVVEKRYIEEEKRLNNFSIEQHNTAKTLEEFKLFMESWERTTEERNKLVIENIKLKEENRELIHRVKELTPKRSRDIGLSR